MKNKNGFTLLELLVVVLIIGILASVALPQYKMAVLKSKFATIKNLTKTMYEAEQRYYLLHGTYTNDFDNLDFDMPKPISKTTGVMRYKDYTCSLQTSEENTQINCSLTVDNEPKIRFMYGIYPTNPPARPPLIRNYCITFSPKSTDDIYNTLCKRETNKTGYCVRDLYCAYGY